MFTIDRLHIFRLTISMNGTDLRLALKELGWKGVELARRLNVSALTVSRWVTGSHPIPGPAVAYVEAMLKLKRVLG